MLAVTAGIQPPLSVGLFDARLVVDDAPGASTLVALDRVDQGRSLVALADVATGAGALARRTPTADVAARQQYARTLALVALGAPAWQTDHVDISTFCISPSMMAQMR